MLSGISCANLNQSNQSIPSIMERISAGDLTEKEIFEIYTKNYKPELEYHEIFQSCISHLYTQKKKTNSSMLSKIFFGFEKIVSNPNKLQIPEMGLKVDCEVYLTRILSNDYRDKKINEKNPLSEKIDELKKKIQNLNERYDNLVGVQSLLQRSENKLKKGITKTSSTTSSTTRTITGGSRIIGGSSISRGSSTSSSTISGGSSSSTTIIGGGSSSSSTSTTTLNINSNVPTYTTTDGEVDINSFNRYVNTLQAQIKAGTDKYSSLEVQYEKVLKEYSVLKTDFGSGKDKECDCEKKLKSCELNLIQKDNEITTLQNIIIELKTKITICETNPPKGDCKDLTLELKKQVEINNKCQKENIEITKKWTTLKTEITTITVKYDSLKIKYDLLIKSYETCETNITIIKKKIVTINKHCDDNVTNLKFEITKLTLEINNCKNDLKKCKDECKKKPDLTGNGKDGLDTYDQCIIRESNLHTTINIKNTRISNLIIQISDRDQEIIDLRSKITILEINIQNCKTDNEKIIKEYEDKIHTLEINIKQYIFEIKTCDIYKRKFEECDKNCRDKITKLESLIVILKLKNTTSDAKLKECQRVKSKLEIEIKNLKIIIIKLEKENKNCSDKEKECTTNLNIKITQITTIIEENKQSILIIQNNFNKRCEEEKKHLLIKITNIEKELEKCNKKKDWEIDVKKCEDRITELLITIKQKITIINNFTIEINTCKKDLEKEKTTNITINNNIKIINITIDTCKNDLKICKDKGPKACDDTKYDTLLVKYKSLSLTYETTINYWNQCKHDNGKLLIELDICKNKKCYEHCDVKLKTCEQNITTITNNYNTKIEIKVTLINQLNIRIDKLEKDCKNDYIDLHLKLKTCESSRIDIKNKYDMCQFELKNEISLRTTYYKELIFIKKEFKNCSKQLICREDEINMFKRVGEKCEENKITITKHLDSLKEKFGKLHNDKVSFISESNSLMTNLSKKCSVDTSALIKFMSTFDISVTELNNFREGIIADIKKDDIEKNKNEGIIQLKIEEITRTKTSITQINIEINKLVKSTEDLMDKLKADPSLIKSIITQLQENETKINKKNGLLITYIERINKSESELHVLRASIKNAETLKTFRNSKYGQVKNISTNVEKSQIDIRRFIDLKTKLSKTVEKKIVSYYKKNDNAQNPLIAILKGEKDIINNKINNYKESTMQLEKKIIELKTKLTLIGDQSNKDEIISGSFKDGSLMKLFQNTDLVLNNCGKLKEFSSKITDICKNQENATLNTNGTNNSSTTTSTTTTTIKINKRKFAKEGEACGGNKKCASGLACLIMTMSDQNRGPNGTMLKDTKPKVGKCEKIPESTTRSLFSLEGEACGDHKKCASGLSCLIMTMSDQNRGPNGTILKDTQPKVGKCKKNPVIVITPPKVVDANKPLDVESQEKKIPLDVESQEVAPKTPKPKKNNKW